MGALKKIVKFNQKNEMILSGLIGESSDPDQFTNEHTFIDFVIPDKFNYPIRRMAKLVFLLPMFVCSPIFKDATAASILLVESLQNLWMSFF